jgi:hypothetical protein
MSTDRLVLGSGIAHQHASHAFTMLMTATVTPPLEAVARNDVSLRSQDYMNALNWYVNLPSTVCAKIVFADNSHSDLTEIASVVPQDTDKSVEFLSFSANDHPVGYGKAYGEFRLIAHALAMSETISPNDWIWKTTGRHVIRNLATLDAKLGRDFDWVCDLHDVPYVNSGMWRDHEQMDLRAFAFKQPVFSQLVGSTWEERKNAFHANLMYHLVRDPAHGFRVCPRFPIQPDIVGVSGRTGRHYDGFAQRSKDQIRGVARRLTPWLWL